MHDSVAGEPVDLFRIAERIQRLGKVIRVGRVRCRVLVGPGLAIGFGDRAQAIHRAIETRVVAERYYRRGDGACRHRRGTRGRAHPRCDGDDPIDTIVIEAELTPGGVRDVRDPATVVCVAHYRLPVAYAVVHRAEISRGIERPGPAVECGQ